MSEANTTTPPATPVKTVVCWCGCGGLTKSRFVQGHDSRFHSRAKQVLRGQLKLDEELAKLPHQEARDEFVAYMESQKGNEATRTAALAAKAADKAKKVADKAKKVAEKAAELAAKTEPAPETLPVDGTPATEPAIENQNAA